MGDSIRRLCLVPRARVDPDTHSRRVSASRLSRNSHLVGQSLEQGGLLGDCDAAEGAPARRTLERGAGVQHAAREKGGTGKG
eukprot:scaffold197086_cov36-Tisochrysis_lutea.AAC.1